MTVKKGKGSIVSSTQSVVTRKNSDSNVNTQFNNNCKDSCNIYVFGSNDWGQLCMGRKTRSIKVPKISLPMISSKVRGASCGWGHSIIIVDSREIWQSGNRVGMADETDKLLPEKLNFTFTNPIEKVACGNTHNIAIDDSGQIYTWGSNFFGELGHGDNMDIWKPKLVKDFENKFVTCVAAGDGFTLALLDDGSVYSWGSGLSGALGHGDRYDQLRPKKIESLDGVKIDLIEAGNHHMVAISNNDNNMESRFYSWGWNACGQLGNNTLEDSLVPIKSSFVIRGKVTSISCGVAHSALVSQIYKLQTNCLYMWGSNKSGQLGFPVMPKAEIFKYPTSIPLSINPYFVKCGGNQTYVATNDKKLYSTGDNYINQLGIVSDEVLEELGEEVSMKQSYKTTLNKADISKLRQRSMRKKTMSVGNSDKEWTVVEGLSFDDTRKEPLSKTGEENNHILMLEKFEEVRLLRGKTIVDIASGNEFVMVLTSKEWIEDGNVDKCMGGYSKSCKQKFGVLKRRHHCRSCGGIFCSACSSNYLYLTEDSNDRVRVCEKCFKHNIST